MKTTSDERTLWQQHIDAWRESGLKQSVWCRQNGVKDSKFWYWKKKLSLLTEQKTQTMNEQPKSGVAEQTAFVPIAVCPDESLPEAPTGLSIELPNGVKVSGVLASNVTLVKSLVEVLL